MKPLTRLSNKNPQRCGVCRAQENPETPFHPLFTENGKNIFFFLCPTCLAKHSFEEVEIED